MSKRTVNLHVGTVADMAARFKKAWQAAERGPVKREEHITFLSLSSFVSSLSSKRLELLKHVRKSGPCSARALAGALGRDYKSVHQDVAKLLETGLLERRADNLLHAPFDKVVAEVDLAA